MQSDPCLKNIYKNARYKKGGKTCAMDVPDWLTV